MIMKEKSHSIALSIVIPVYNERENVSRLYEKLKSVLFHFPYGYEILVVDDGSKDGTFGVLKNIAQKDKRFRVIRLRRNFGQSAAMAVGFRAARGKKIITMDGDLQNDPEDIPLLLQKLEQGYDVVSGWRKNRKDKMLVRKIPSWIANRLICSVTDVRLHDTGCALKAFRKEVVDRIRLYGELHRFLPALARVEGASITEMVVRHHPRRFGKSKYTLTRTFKVLMDMTSLYLFLKHLRNPLRFFGSMAVFFFGIAILLCLWIAYLASIRHIPVLELNVLVTLVFLFFVAGFQWMFIGIISTLVVRTGNRELGVLFQRMEEE